MGEEVCWKVPGKNRRLKHGGRSREIEVVKIIAKDPDNFKYKIQTANGVKTVSVTEITSGTRREQRIRENTNGNFSF